MTLDWKAAGSYVDRHWTPKVVIHSKGYGESLEESNDKGTDPSSHLCP